MSFFKKLFGKENQENESREDELENPLTHIQDDEDGYEEEMEVVVHDSDESERIELIDDEILEEVEETEEEPIEKSIDEIVDDIEEVSEKPDFSNVVEVEIDENSEVHKKPVEDVGIFDVIGQVEEDLEVGVNTETTVIEVDDAEASEENSDEVSDTTDEVDAESKQETAEKAGFFTKLKDGIKKTRESIFDNLNSVFNMFTTIDEDLFEELEEALILADMGVDTSLQIINELRSKVKKKGITEVSEVKHALIEVISEILSKDDTELVITPPTVILVIGVNGAGKTTTIGKLAHNYMKEGNSVTIAAADTFRAAAIEQLEVWANRTGAHFIRKEEGSDPASVVFDACKSAKARNTDILIIDTAGRLQNKKNLMEELKKIYKIISREFEEAQKEVFLVLDSTTGQNAMQQAKLFNETADITGLVLTKLDGTAKGGVIVSIKNELSVPVRFVGIGEKIDDLERFDSKSFAKALFE